MRRILSSAPFDLVDFLLYFEGFEVIEFGFVRLEFGMKLVLAGLFLQTVSPRSIKLICITHRLVSLEKNNTATFVSCC